MTEPQPLPEAIAAAARAFADLVEAGDANSVSIAYDGTRVKWLAWTAAGVPVTGSIEVGNEP